MFNYENFSLDYFVNYVMDKMRLSNVEEPLKSKIEKEILRTLNDRIISTIFNAMTDENVDEFEVIRDSNPEMTDFGVLLEVVDKIPALQEIMMKAVNDLAEELVFDVNRLDSVVKP